MRIAWTIHLRLALLAGAMALLLSMLSVWWGYLDSCRASQADGERAVLQLMAVLRRPAAAAAASGNRPLAAEVVASLTSSDLVRYARLTGRNGLDVRAGLSRHQLRHWLALPSPSASGEASGWLEVEPDLPRMAEQARLNAWHAGLLLAGQALIVALTVYLAASGLVSRPLAGLSSRLHRILPGSSERLSLRARLRGSELKRLTDDINGLLNTVQMVVNIERGLREHLRLLEKRFRGVFEHAGVAILLMDGNGKLLLSNPAFRLLLGREVAPDEQGEWIPELLLQPQRLWLRADESRRSGAPMAEDLQTGRGWLHAIVSACLDDDGRQLYQCLFYDISERKASEEVMRRMADYDHLTGVYSRLAGEQLLTRRVAQAAASHHSLAVMMLDLDHFKLINDSYGHEAGDAVLKEVARRLRALLVQDELLVRLGGDEFMVVLSGGEAVPRAVALAGQMLEAAAAPIALGPERQARVGASIGIAFYPEHGDTASDLRCNADRGMYEVKRRGRNDYAIFSGKRQDVPPKVDADD
ncbi:sensor domain-containing diguanylate cyclase [Chromobacterium sphagni]|nr:sensor domain-containing diguanylate cyclase [Chromobacterium sphagni]